MTTRAPPADDAAFLAAYRLEDYPRPSVAVDVAALTVVDSALHVALYRRAAAPSAGTLALPGGFVALNESLDDAARRVLADKAGLREVFVEQLYTFGAPQRDPRGRIISVAYVALVDAARFALADTDHRRYRLDVPWAGETGGPVTVVDDTGSAQPLAFDHDVILGMAVKRLRGKIDYSPIGFQLLPQAFTLRQLQDVHEVVRGESVNKDSFRRRMLATGQLEATGEHERDVTWRPAELYRFVRRSAV
jgi:8-oxo-dGTP diphosphatase